jgi:antitoxin component YwqK of YwqJK toxin-antitoxin module
MKYEENLMKDGKLEKSWLSDNGELHREDGPAFILYYDSGQIQTEEFFIFDKNHRAKGPAIIDYYEDGPIEREVFFLYGMRHRIDGPAEISYYEDGSIHHEEWYINGNYLGEEKDGFWGLWDYLDNNEKKHPNILKYLTKYS